VFWYTREKQDDGGAAAAEMLAIKQREEDLMAEARRRCQCCDARHGRPRGARSDAQPLRLRRRSASSRGRCGR